MTTDTERQAGPDLPRAWVTDFDDTVAVTISERPIDGLDVNDAYELSLKGLFGDAALERYQAYGGHRNRTPAQIVADSVPGIALDELPEAATQLKHCKLELLVGQIGLRTETGAKWPRPTPGFLEFAQAIEKARWSSDTLTTGIISAGHIEFIQEFYSAWRLMMPDIVVTDEVIETHRPDLTYEERAKPNPHAMTLFRSFWQERQTCLEQGAEQDELIVYSGDDPIKDAQLAANSGARFVRISAHGEPNNWPLVAQELGIQLESAQRG